LNKSIIIHPFLFAIFPLIFLFSNNVSSVIIDEIILPLLLVIFAAFLIWITLSVVLKNKIKSGFITSLGFILFFSYGHIYILLDELQKDVHLSKLFVLIPFFILFILGTYYFIKTKKPLNKATTIVNVVSISLVLISFVSIGEYFITQNYDDLNEISEQNPIQLANAQNFPDIYYIILDAYAGSKSLQTILNYDNSEFTDFLTEKGFYVSAESFSNYKRTAFSIPSTLNMKYINDLVKEEELDPLRIENRLDEMARDSTVVQYLKSKGYTIVAIEAGSIHTSRSEQVDLRLCPAGNYGASPLVTLLIQTSMLEPIHVQLFSDDHRERILCGFSELAKMSEGNVSPKFVLAHLNIPHQPLIFGPNGEEVTPKNLSPDDIYGDWSDDGYIGQVKFTNKKMKEIVEKLTKTDTPPIIIIQSDHGMRGGPSHNDYEIYLKQFNNFKAYYFPDKGRNLEFETTTPVNSFRVLFNLYFDEQYELLEDKIYDSTRDKTNKSKLYEFTDITEFLIGK